MSRPGNIPGNPDPESLEDRSTEDPRTLRGNGRITLALLGRLMGFAALQVVILVLLWQVRGEGDDDNYLAATWDKHRHLRATAGRTVTGDGNLPRRLLLVGGSSVAFGSRAAQMEEDLGFPVINLGLVGGLGLDFLLSEAGSSARTGDWILVMPEYELLSGGASRTVLRQIIDLRPSALRWIPARYRRDLVLEQGFGWVGGLARRSVFGAASSRESPDPVYRRSGFNTHGDLVSHAGQPATYGETGQAVGVPGLVPSTSDAWLADEVLRRFARWAQRQDRRGIRVVVAAPPYPEGAYPGVADRARRAWDMLDAVAGVGILLRPEDALHPDEDFFDTGYHLTHEAARRRTARLVEEVRRWMGRGDASDMEVGK
jgi:hypothetical protein